MPMSVMGLRCRIRTQSLIAAVLVASILPHHYLLTERGQQTAGRHESRLKQQLDGIPGGAAIVSRAPVFHRNLLRTRESPKTIHLISLRARLAESSRIPRLFELNHPSALTALPLVSLHCLLTI